MSLPSVFTHREQKEILRLTGRDRLSFLQGMVSNEVLSLDIGHGCYAFHLTSKGQVVADLHILCLADSLVLVTEAGWGESLSASLEHHLVMERVRIQPPVQEEVLFVGGIDAGSAIEALGYSGAALWTEGQHAEVEGQQILFRNALGFVWVGDSSNSELALKAQEIAPLDPMLVSGYRIEAGIPLGRTDFDEKTLALETGQAARGIHFKKGCYIGQEVVARIDARGHTNRGLVGFVSDSLLEPGARVLIDGKDVGWITSSAPGPRKGSPVSLGYVRHEVSSEGTSVLVEGTLATVCALPMVGASR